MIEKGLADNGDLHVMRKKVGGGKTVKEKHAEDIWTLVSAIRKCECIPRWLWRALMHSGRMWMLCGQRSSCKGDWGALGREHHRQILHAVRASFEEFG